MSVKLYKTVEDWWDDLDYDLKVELMANEFPDEAYLIEVEEVWDGLNFEENTRFITRVMTRLS